MAQSKSTRSDEFDSLVIGGGLAGLIAAHILEGTGRKVALIDGLDTFGGSYRPVVSKIGLLDHGLKLISDTAAARESLDWLSGVLGERISITSIEAPPITYDEGRFKPFVGFGDQKVATAAEIDAYARDRYLRLSPSSKDWVRNLAESFTGVSYPLSYVTKMQVDDEFVIEVLVNGSKRLSGREVVFAANPQQLARLLPEAHVPVKLRQKLLKGDFWTSIHLDLIHSSQVTDSSAVHVLKGANEEPSFGLFHPFVETDQAQLSQWITLVPKDITDEPELVASALKQIKRQMKRAYEHALDGLLQERIVVSPGSHGDLCSALAPDGRWPKLQNLWLISALMDRNKNLVGLLQQTRRTLSSIAGEPPLAFELESDFSQSSAFPSA